MPNAPSQAHLQGTQSRHTKPTLQKSLPCANAQATLHGWTETHNIEDSGDRANVQQGVCQNTGGRKLSSAFCNSIVLHIVSHRPSTPCIEQFP